MTIPKINITEIDIAEKAIMIRDCIINTSNNGQYYYLCDSNGQIIYHMRQLQISNGTFNENSEAIAKYKDGVYHESLDGERRTIIVNTISYTGWKLVGVIPNSTFTHDMFNVRYFILMLMFLMAMMLAVVNRIVSLINNLSVAVTQIIVLTVI